MRNKLFLLSILWASAISLTFGGLVSFAQSTSQVQNPSNTLDSRFKALNELILKHCPPTKDRPTENDNKVCEEVQKAFLELAIKGEGKTSNEEKIKKECDEAIKDFNTKMSEFNSATKGLKDTGYSDLGQALVCEKCPADSSLTEEVSYCTNEGLKELEETERKQKRELERQARARGVRPTNGKVSSTSIGADRQKVAVCPMYAAATAKKLKKDVDEARKQSREDDDKLSELIRKKQEEENDIREAQAVYAKKEKELKKSRDEAFKKLTQNATAATKEMQKKYDEASSAISQIMNQVWPALQEEYRAKVTATQLECEKQAFQKLDAYLAERKQKMASNTLSAGQFYQLAQQTGSTRKQKNASIADRQFQNCLASGQYKAQIKLIENDFAIKQKGLEIQLQSLQSTMAQISQEISSTQRQNEFSQNLNEVENEFQDALASIRTDLMTKTQAKTQKIQLLDVEISKLQILMQETSARLTMQMSILSMADNKSKGRLVGEDDESKYLSSFTSVKTATSHAWARCQCSAESKLPQCTGVLEESYCTLESNSANRSAAKCRPQVEYVKPGRPTSSEGGSR